MVGTERPSSSHQSLTQQQQGSETTTRVPTQQRGISSPQHHQLTPDTRVRGGKLFDLFYSLIFSLVHVALTAILAPVLGNKDQQRNRRRTHLPPHNMEESDPELAIPTDEIINMNSGSSSFHQPILKSTQGLSRRNFADDVAVPMENNNKSVHFPAPERARPPLGRIGLTPSSLSSSCSGGGSTASSSLSKRASKGGGSTASSSSSKRASKRERRPKVITPQTTIISSPVKSGVHMASSPFQSPRMVHSTYFLE